PPRRWRSCRPPPGSARPATAVTIESASHVVGAFSIPLPPDPELGLRPPTPWMPMHRLGSESAASALLSATCRAAPHVTWRPREPDRARARSPARAGAAGGHRRADRRGGGDRAALRGCRSGWLAVGV